ncbi:MAG: RluA family pseudouridine synthase [Gammaproteobacteria bacterium]
MDPISNKPSQKTINKGKITSAVDSAKPGTIHFQTVQYITIDVEHTGRRIDNFLNNFFKTVPKGRIYKMLRKGEVRVNKKRIKPNYRLELDDNLRIPPVFVEENFELKISHRVIDQLKASILFEDDAFLILNKPSGIPVHAGTGCDFGVIEAFRSMPEYKDGYIELAHRLDRATSGCLILVKQPAVLRRMNELIKTNKMDKHYLALVKGRWKGGKQIVDAPLVKNSLSSGERLVRVDENGKSALTEFDLMKQFSETSLLKVKLHTGRTHQIRVHCAHIGMPIALDDKYGNDEFNKKLKKAGLKRLFLHASHLSFQLTDMDRISIDAPLPQELQQIVK